MLQRHLYAMPALVLLLLSPAFGGVGDEWTARRGDLTPGFTYAALGRTNTGRLIAVGQDGQLMLSDDAGSTWRFRQLHVGGVPVHLPLTDIQAFTVSGTGQPRIAVVGGAFEEGTGGAFAYGIATTIFLSDDDGDTWTRHPFPFASAAFLGRDFHGVNVSKLHVSPAGHLLAFGTTSVTDNFVLVWSIGGLIYRSLDGVTWQEARFAYGPLAEMADTGAGRVVAVGSTTALDSADGAGWNGYLLRDAVIRLPNAQPLDSVTLNRLRLEDVGVQNGTYVAHAVTYVPYDDAGTIDSSTVARRFVLVSASPFGPGRLWTAYETTQYWGKLFATPPALLGFGNVLSRSLDAGVMWSPLDPSVVAPAGTVTRVNPSTLVAVGSSDTVWRSGSDGTTWSKVWDRGAGPNLRLLGLFNGTLFAVGDNDLWISETNGQNWVLRAAGVSGSDLVQVGGRLILATGSAQLVRTSDDFGATWQPRTVPGPSSTNAPALAVANGGRVVLAAESKSVQNQGAFFVSDDAGTTWLPRNAGLVFGEDPYEITRTASGRLIAFVTEFAGFNPKLIISDDNGDTWRTDSVLKTLDGLDPISNEPQNRVIEVGDIAVSPTGRLVMRGDDELLTSDDDGTTWTVRINLDYPFTPPNLFWEITDLAQSGTRWVAIGRKRTPYPQSKNLHFALVSDDDGSTWREVPLPLRQNNTFLDWLSRGRDGRLVVAGSNAAVYTSDGQVERADLTGALSVREADTLAIPVKRPPVAGTVQLRYSAVQRTALATQDYQPLGGILTWGPTNLAPQSITLLTVDDAVVEQPEQLAVQVVFEHADVQGRGEIAVTITDDDGGSDAELQLEGATGLYTSESGQTATLKIALNRKPTADVAVAVAGVDPTEGLLSTTLLTFTPQNWNRQQSLIVTGIDDAEADGDVAYSLRLDTSSADSLYAAVADTVASVVNLDDEPPTTGGTTTTTTPGAPTTTTTSIAPGAPTSTTAPPASTTTTTLPPCTTARCILDEALHQGSCAGVAVPAPIGRKLDKALATIDAAAAQPEKKARKTRRRAVQLLKAAGKMTARSARGKRPKLTSDCANAIREAASQVQRTVGG